MNKWDGRRVVVGTLVVTAVHPHQLEQRYQKVQHHFHNNGEPNPPEISSLLECLEKLLQQAHKVS